MSAPTQWFAQRLLAWHDRHGRRGLPWHEEPTPYRVWVSEIMLQQTQVDVVRPYFLRFMARFPDLATLAAAPREEVLRLWAGLGYYARARNLHRAAAAARQGLPDTFAGLVALPGIGRSTAGAILAIAHGQRAAILDGNVKRVLARFHGVAGHPGERAVERTLWERAEAHTPTARPGDYAQAIMDFGATLCRRANPACDSCPVAARCVARAAGRQAELPTPRRAKPLPERRARAFLLVDPTGACYLERRPDTGVWGGLWSPPTRPADTQVEALAAEWGLEVRRVLSPPPVRHVFSHYRLWVTPHYVGVGARPATMPSGAGHVWHRPRDGRKLALSPLAVRLLAGLAGGLGLDGGLALE